MTIYQALRILSSGRKVCFTNRKVDGKFDLEKSQKSFNCTGFFDPAKEDVGWIFSYGVKFANIIIVDEDGNILVKEAFTPTPQEKEECARYHRCDFYSLTDNQEIPFVRRRKPKDTLEKIADKIDEYIVRHNLRLDDPDEDEYGQCVSSFMLADALADDEVLAARAAKLTGGKLRTLAGMFFNRTIWIDEEADEGIGEVCFIDLARTPEGIRVDIWDGYPC